MRYAIAAFTVLLAFAGVRGAPAQTPAPAPAHAEFCAAGVAYFPAIPATSDGRSTGLIFGLLASSPRTLDDATIIADTDGGWYTFDLSRVTLTAGKYGLGYSPFTMAVFDKPVFVRHAWVTKAQGRDCGLPTFGGAFYSPRKAQPSQGLRRIVARPIPAPYTTDCAQPFAEATVVHPVHPDFPRGLAPVMSSGTGPTYVSEIEVMVGDRDDLVDAWVYKRSVSPEVDANALRAARASTYRSAVSYCHKANGDYLFRADFEP